MRATFLELIFDFAYFNRLFVSAQAITEKPCQTYRSVELINRLIAYFIFNSIDMAPGRMRNISAGYDLEQNKDHENGESCRVYLSYEFLV